jgi:uncharacterized protein (DUF3084 family)
MVNLRMIQCASSCLPTLENEHQKTENEQRTTNIGNRKTNIKHRKTNNEQRTTNIGYRKTNIKHRKTNIGNRTSMKLTEIETNTKAPKSRRKEHLSLVVPSYQPFSF